MNTYETITVDQLANRFYTADEHSFRSFTGSYLEKSITETTYAVLARNSQGIWENVLETTDEQEAIKKLAWLQNLRGDEYEQKIVVLQPTTNEEEKPAMEIGHTTIGYYDDDKEEWVTVEVEINLSDPDYPKDEEEALVSQNER